MHPAKEIGFGFRSRALAYLALLFLVAFSESTFKWKYPDRTQMPIEEMRGILIAFSRFERTKKTPRRYFEK
jgi:hypothetical protein